MERLHAALRSHHAAAAKALKDKKMTNLFKDAVSGQRDANRVAALLRRETKKLAALQSRCAAQQATVEKEKKAMNDVQSQRDSQQLYLAKLTNAFIVESFDQQ